jgi:Arc/MetJ family transcription regulator
MKRRSTYELDEELIERARRALGLATKRATIEEALRRAVAHAASEEAERPRLQLGYLERIASYADIGLLRSEAMWR